MMILLSLAKGGMLGIRTSRVTRPNILGVAMFLLQQDGNDCQAWLIGLVKYMCILPC